MLPRAQNNHDNSHKNKTDASQDNRKIDSRFGGKENSSHEKNTKAKGNSN